MYSDSQNASFFVLFPPDRPREVCSEAWRWYLACWCQWNSSWKWTGSQYVSMGTVIKQSLLAHVAEGLFSLCHCASVNNVSFQSFINASTKTWVWNWNAWFHLHTVIRICIKKWEVLFFLTFHLQTRVNQWPYSGWSAVHCNSWYGC